MEQEQMEKNAEEMERKIVRFTNIDKESFTHSFRGISTTVAVGASQVMRLPEADHLATHLARKILSREKKLRKDLSDKGVQLWTEKEVYGLKERILSEMAVENQERITAEEFHKQDTQELQEKYAPKEINITKKDVIKELEKRGQEVDVSNSKEELLTQLMELEAQGK
mgnify:CR=1 FL=1